MRQTSIAARVEQLAQPLATAHGMEVVDVEYIRAHDSILRVYLDKEGGVDLNDCQAVSEALGELLDREDIIRDNYLLEVSSPGIDRVIKKEKDMRRFAGAKVDVKLFAKTALGKEFTAVLNGVTDDGQIRLLTDDGEILLDNSQLAQMRLHVEF